MEGMGHMRRGNSVACLAVGTDGMEDGDEEETNPMERIR